MTFLSWGSALIAASAVSCAAVGSIANASPAVIPAKWKNCTVVNKRYAHGVGRVGAHDRTSGTPVTTFVRNNYLYKLAMRYNRGLDRDRDGIACERA
jgi:hypothetical protein